MFIDTNSSFLKFTYPFLFQSNQYNTIIDGLSNAYWSGKKRSIKVWELQSFPVDDLLAHVSKFLNCDLDNNPTALLWKLSHDALSSPSGLGASANWHLITRKNDYPFQIETIDMAIFQVGVGTITVQVKPISSVHSASDWIDFIHYFRFGGGQRDVSLSSERSVGYDQATKQPVVENYFPEVAGGMEQHPNRTGILMDLLNALLFTVNSQEHQGFWWEDVFIPGQLIPFVALFIDEIDPTEIPYLTYRVRNFYDFNRQLVPVSEQLSSNNDNLLPYAENQWHFFSVNGGGFLGCNVPQNDFFRGTLTSHLKNQYFLLFILALHQRFALIMLSENVAEEWGTLLNHSNNDLLNIYRSRELSFEQILDRLLYFTARGYFSQVVQKENHHNCYHKWQEVFQVDHLYQEVSDEIRFMHDYLQTNQEKRRAIFERGLSFIAWVIGIPALGLTFIGALSSVDITTAIFTLVGGLFAGLLLFGFMKYFNM